MKTTNNDLRAASNALYTMMYSETLVADINKAISKQKDLPFVQSPAQAVELFLNQNSEYKKLSASAQLNFDKKALEDFILTQVNFLQVSKNLYYIA